MLADLTRPSSGRQAGRSCWPCARADDLPTPQAATLATISADKLAAHAGRADALAVPMPCRPQADRLTRSGRADAVPTLADDSTICRALDALAVALDAVPTPQAATLRPFGCADDLSRWPFRCAGRRAPAPQAAMLRPSRSAATISAAGRADAVPTPQAATLADLMPRRWPLMLATLRPQRWPT